MINKQLQMQLEAQLAMLKQLPNDMPVYQIKGGAHIEATAANAIALADDDFKAVAVSDDATCIVI